MATALDWAAFLACAAKGAFTIKTKQLDIPLKACIPIPNFFGLPSIPPLPDVINLFPTAPMILDMGGIPLELEVPWPINIEIGFDIMLPGLPSLSLPGFACPFPDVTDPGNGGGNNGGGNGGGGNNGGGTGGNGGSGGNGAGVTGGIDPNQQTGPTGWNDLAELPASDAAGGAPSTNGDPAWPDAEPNQLNPINGLTNNGNAQSGSDFVPPSEPSGPPAGPGGDGTGATTSPIGMGSIDNPAAGQHVGLGPAGGTGGMDGQIACVTFPADGPPDQTPDDEPGVIDPLTQELT